jgi:hypothetical protein
MDPSTGAAVSVIKQTFKALCKYRLKIYNLIFRPNLKIDIKEKTIVFIDNSAVEHQLRCFCLIIENQSKKSFSLKPIQIGNEPYQCILQQDQAFRDVNNDFWHTSDEIYSVYKNHWREISENEFLFEVKPNEKKCFPINLKKEYCRALLDIKKDSILFFTEKKINISMSIKTVKFEYGLKKLDIWPKYIRYLSN